MWPGQNLGNQFYDFPYLNKKNVLTSLKLIIYNKYSTFDKNSWGTPYLETPQNLLNCVLGYSLTCPKLILGCSLRLEL